MARNPGNKRSTQRLEWYRVISDASRSRYVTLTTGMGTFAGASRMSANSVISGVKQMVVAGLRHYGLQPFNPIGPFDNMDHATQNINRLVGAEQSEAETLAMDAMGFNTGAAGSIAGMPAPGSGVSGSIGGGKFGSAPTVSGSWGGFGAGSAPINPAAVPAAVGLGGGRAFTAGGYSPYSSPRDILSTPDFQSALVSIGRDEANAIRIAREDLSEFGAIQSKAGTTGTDKLDCLKLITTKLVITSVAVTGDPGTEFKLVSGSPEYDGSATWDDTDDGTDFDPSLLVGIIRQYRLPAADVASGAVPTLILPVAIVNDHIALQVGDTSQKVEYSESRSISDAKSMRVDHLGAPVLL